MIDKYKELMKKYEELSTLGSIRGVLNYDIETKTMPPAALEHRGKQFSLLASLIHQKQIQPDYTNLLETLNKSTDLDDLQRRNVELLHRRYLSSSAVPEELVGKISIQANKTNQAWKNAKHRGDWKLVVDDVRDLFSLVSERGRMIGEVTGIGNPQSALLNERDPGFGVENLERIFTETRSYLVPLLKKIQETREEIDISFLRNSYPKQVKVRLAETIADLFQYDYHSENAHGRIGDVEHPLTITCGPKDARITVNYSKNYVQVMSSTQHELGHGLHALNRGDGKSPVSHLTPPSVNEMTSRYTENKIGKSIAFFDAYHPTFQKITGSTTTKDQFYRGFTHVEPGAIRTEADEVSYGLHIIIRFEIERMLFREEIEFEEIPGVWNDKYHKYLGVDVENVTDGPLQDLHWFSYYWCYFQGYALGDLLGSQIHFHMERELPNWAEDLSAGNMGTVNRYLEERVYRLGARYDPLEMVEQVTGEKFNSKYLRMYLEQKYLG